VHLSRFGDKFPAGLSGKTAIHEIQKVSVRKGKKTGTTISDMVTGTGRETGSQGERGILVLRG
jgi:hypothetical protein